MELTHLVSTLKRRPLLAFVLGGALLFGARRAATVAWADLGWSEPELVALTVQVPADADEREVARATDEAILLSFAIHAGFIESDSVIGDRLVRNMEFVQPDVAHEAAIAEAMRLGMHLTDPVVRQRLIWLAEQTLMARTRATPTDATLQRYLDEHAERFAEPATLSFEHIFVSRDVHGEALDEEVRRVAGELARRHEPGDGRVHSDPSLLPSEMKHATHARIDTRFGAGFAAALTDLEPGAWSKPIRTALGAHFVRISERRASVVPPPSRIRERLRYEYERDSRDERVREALRRMRAAYRVDVRRSS